MQSVHTDEIERIYVNTDTRTIMTVNTRLLFDEKFREEVLRNPSKLFELIGIEPPMNYPEIKMPEFIPSNEFKSLVESIANAMRTGNNKLIEDYEYATFDYNNLTEVIAVLAVAVAVAVVLWVYGIE